MDFGPKPIFPSKDAAKGRNILDSFFVGKISYYMVTPAASFFDAESKLEKLSGVTGVYIRWTLTPEKNFYFWTRHSSSPRNFCRYSYLRPEFRCCAKRADSNSKSAL